MSKEVTIQKTRKRYKLAMLLGIIGILVGVGMHWGNQERAPDDYTGLTIFILAIILFLYGRIGKWWNND